MNKVIYILLLFVLIVSQNAFATLLMDLSQVPEDKHQDVLITSKMYSWPTAAHWDYGKLQPASESLEDLQKICNDFESEGVFQTPESLFVSQKLNEEFGVSIPVIQIPTTAWDLMMIHKYTTEEGFAESCQNSVHNGRLNRMGTEYEKRKWCDKNYLKLTIPLFQIFSTFGKKEELVDYVMTLIEEIRVSPKSSKNQREAFTDDSSEIIKNFLLQELTNQTEGKVSLCRATGGFVLREGMDDYGPVLSQHPSLIGGHVSDEACLRSFITKDRIPALNLENGNCFPKKEDKDKWIQELKKIIPGKSLENYRNIFDIMRREAREERLKAYKENRCYFTNDTMRKVLDVCYQNLTPICHITDYPFESWKEFGEELIVGDEVLSSEAKKMSFGYSPLAGFLFDGSEVRQSACSFDYITRGNKSFFLYEFSLPIWAMYELSKYFSLPDTPLYQGVFDSGEVFHPRAKGPVKPFGDEKYEVQDIEQYSRILLDPESINVLAIAGTAISGYEDYVYALKQRNLEVLERIKNITSPSIQEVIIIKSDEEIKIESQLRYVFNYFKNSGTPMYCNLDERGVQAVLQRAKEICFESEEVRKPDSAPLKEAYIQVILLPSLERFFDDKEENSSPDYLMNLTVEHKDKILNIALEKSCIKNSQQIDCITEAYDQVMTGKLKYVFQYFKGRGVAGYIGLGSDQEEQIIDHALFLMKDNPEEFPLPNSGPISTSVSQVIPLPSLERFFDDKEENNSPDYLMNLTVEHKDKILNIALEKSYIKNFQQIDCITEAYDQVMTGKLKYVFQYFKGRGVAGYVGLDSDQEEQIIDRALLLMKDNPEEFPLPDSGPISTSVSYFNL